MPISYVIRKDTPSTDDGDNRDVQIIHQSILVGNMFTRDSRKVIDILNKLTLGIYLKTSIKGLKCGRNTMQDLQARYDGTSEVTQGKKLLYLT